MKKKKRKDDVRTFLVNIEHDIQVKPFNIGEKKMCYWCVVSVFWHFYCVLTQSSKQVEAIANRRQGKEREKKTDFSSVLVNEWVCHIILYRMHGFSIAIIFFRLLRFRFSIVRTTQYAWRNLCSSMCRFMWQLFQYK